MGLFAFIKLVLSCLYYDHVVHTNWNPNQHTIHGTRRRKQGPVDLDWAGAWSPVDSQFAVQWFLVQLILVAYLHIFLYLTVTCFGVGTNWIPWWFSWSQHSRLSRWACTFSIVLIARLSFGPFVSVFPSQESYLLHWHPPITNPLPFLQAVCLSLAPTAQPSYHDSEH